MRLLLLLLLPFFMGYDLPVKYPEKTLTMSIETLEKSGYNSGSTVTPLSISNSPGKSYSTTKRQKRTISYRYKNPDFVHPGPLTIINPYVLPKK